MKTKEELDGLDQAILEAVEKVGTSLAAVSKYVIANRSTVYNRMRKLGLLERPVAEGSVSGVEAKQMPYPPKGQIKRYILTSAQNNTHLNEPVWQSLLALADHYDADILVGTFSYNQNHYGNLAVKRDTKDDYQKDLWFADAIKPYFSDKRLILAEGLVWCGEMNILPTAEKPLSGLETYSRRKSAIFPHVKMAMRSVAAMKGEGTKLIYTTGTVTLMNYVQKKAGLKGEHHHVYGAVLVEVNSDGVWWVRQLDAEQDGTIQDLNVKVKPVLKGERLREISIGNRVEAITWGDIHATCASESVVSAALNCTSGMLATLRPAVQFLHDLLEGVSINPHGSNNCHDRFRAFKRGFLPVEKELDQTAEVLRWYSQGTAALAAETKTVIVDSNHDSAWIERWLREHDYRRDPTNAILFLELQLQLYKSLAAGLPINMLEAAMRRFDISEKVIFLKTDESYPICDRKIECGLHGHLGPNGARGTPENLNKVGRKAITGHTHSAGIFDGLYVTGTSSDLDMGYNKGPSSWSNSHVVTYPSGKRTIITVYNGKWRA